MPSTPTVPPAADALLAALEHYGSRVTQLTTRWKDAELYHAVSQEVDTVRHACESLPGMEPAWVALLIAHAELMHALWQAPGDEAAAAERQRLLARVQQEVRGLQAMAMRVAGS